MESKSEKHLVVDRKLHKRLKIRAIKNNRTLQDELADILKKELRD